MIIVSAILHQPISLGERDFFSSPEWGVDRRVIPETIFNAEFLKSLPNCGS
jgi:hypothetical protein